MAEKKPTATTRLKPERIQSELKSERVQGQSAWNLEGGHAVSGIRRTFVELPGWTFEIDEVSAGVYSVRGVDEVGRSVASTGTDPDTVLSECRQSAAKIQATEIDRGRK